jgi:hypothetical protein
LGVGRAEERAELFSGDLTVGTPSGAFGSVGAGRIDGTLEGLR